MQNVKKKLLDFDVEMSETGFGIYGRSYVATAGLLAYCSPLKFHFMNRLLARGWLDILIIGDTRCGKTEIMSNLVRNIRLGEFFKCENTSFAGLVGGLHQVSTRAKWDIVWGKIPLNNGKLVVADEMSSLSIDVIGNMSALRSSGVAEVTKIQSGQTQAATRIVWISNPRSDANGQARTMGAYQQGVRAIQELIGRPEDIARFDFAIAVATDDVPMDAINRNRPHKAYDAKWSELRNLIRWVWQLQPKDVIFTQEATDAALTLAKEMSKEFSSNIPLVEPNEQRIRIARVSAAVAARCFSEIGGKLVVKAKHVEFAVWFMRRCFCAKPMAYDTYSKSANSEESFDLDTISHTRDTFAMYMKNDWRRLKVFFDMNDFSVQDVENVFDLIRQETRQLVSILIRNGVIVRHYSMYRKSKIGTRIIELILKEQKLL